LRVGILTTHAPHPATSGGRIRLASFVHALALDHDVRLLVLSSMQPESVDATRSQGVELAHLAYPAWDERSLPDRLRHDVASIIRRSVPTFEAVNTADSRRLISWLGDGADVAIIDTTSLARFGRLLRGQFPSLKIILNTHNIESGLYESLAAQGGIARRVHRRIAAATTRRLEGALDRYADLVLAVSEGERQQLEQMSAGRVPVAVAPNAVDTDHVRALPPATARNLILCGAMNYEPNTEGAQWFIRNVLPQIHQSAPDAKLLVVGRSPPPWLRSLAGPSIEVAADVPDVRPYYARSAVAVVPLLRGGGTRLKILEALALGRPVVSTSIGADGLAPTSAIDIVDSPLQFADAVIRILRSSASATEHIGEGMRYVEQRYSWHALRDVLGDILAKDLRADS